MPLATTRELLDDARAARSAVLAFNVITAEHAEGIVRGAEAAGRSVVLSLSQNAIRYHGSADPMAALLVALASAARVPIAVHLDHVEDVELLQVVPDGVSSVMVDAGALPYDNNVALTAAQTERLHARGILVEAELGYVGGKKTQVTSAHQAGTRTDPDQAVRFVEETEVDALAVAVGTMHARIEQSSVVDLDLVERLAGAVPVPLVLHGSSGVPDADLRRAVDSGIRKINVGTALNVAFTGAVRAVLDASDTVDPRDYLATARDAVADVVSRLASVVASS